MRFPSGGGQGRGAWMGGLSGSQLFAKGNVLLGRRPRERRLAIAINRIDVKVSGVIYYVGCDVFVSLLDGHDEGGGSAVVAEGGVRPTF